ncbi:hypothetical protein E8D34_10680 [Nocardioides sp. GY 10113]|uniref:hypothetical protein n=1 Tax=Nocardioides sp. GY 10113 TaxID=2569761 RepID=UPI0010A79EA0|nr:hypothetical protein [Nocardioides sp. GY 10113]TIC86708.1 hypothetical protein E8D34_10680 [Nocardioides sp. GY 10113]
MTTQDATSEEVPPEPSALSGEEGGVWQIVTEASLYILDLERGRLMRTPGAGLGPHVAPDGVLVRVTDLAGDRAWLTLVELWQCRIGFPLLAFCEDEHGDNPMLRWSTHIISIRRLPASHDAQHPGHEEHPSPPSADADGPDA